MPAHGQELGSEHGSDLQLVPHGVEGSLEVEGSEQLAERVFGEECNVDVQLRQQVDKLLGLLGIGLRRKCPFGGLELTLPASLQRGQVAEAAPDLCACVSTLSGPPDPERIAEMAAPYGLTLLGPPLSRD